MVMYIYDILVANPCDARDSLKRKKNNIAIIICWTKSECLKTH